MTSLRYIFKMNYYIESYGCTMNQGETQMLSETLIGEENNRVESPEEADTAIIGTCVVISKTEERMKRRIKELNSLCDNLIITGCLTTTSPEMIRERYPDSKIIPPRKIDMSYCVDSDLIGVIPISSGCLGNCSYCITKIARGELKSRDPCTIKYRFKKLVDSSAKEIQITCQDTASYGLDIGYSLPELLEDLLEFDGNYRIRIGMMNPDTASPIMDRIISLMSDKRIYKFLHLPLQSGSESILRDMGRRYTPLEWEKIVKEFRENFPDLTLSTDIITGFPGETNDDFEDTVKILETVNPDIVNITRYSPRPGTSAYEMGSKIHSRIKKRRSKKLTQLRLNISKKRNERYIGNKEEILVTEKGKGESLKGRMDNYKVVVLKNKNIDLIGKRVKVKIIDAKEVYLVGKLL